MLTGGCTRRWAIVSGLLFTMKRPTTTCGGGSAVMMRNPVVGTLQRPRRAPTLGLAAGGRFRRLARSGWIQRRGHRVVDPLEPDETHLRPPRPPPIPQVLFVAPPPQHPAGP